MTTSGTGVFGGLVRITRGFCRAAGLVVLVTHCRPSVSPQGPSLTENQAVSRSTGDESLSSEGRSPPREAVPYIAPRDLEDPAQCNLPYSRYHGSDVVFAWHKEPPKPSYDEFWPKGAIAHFTRHSEQEGREVYVEAWIADNGHVITADSPHQIVLKNFASYYPLCKISTERIRAFKERSLRPIVLRPSGTLPPDRLVEVDDFFSLPEMIVRTRSRGPAPVCSSSGGDFTLQSGKSYSEIVLEIRLDGQSHAVLLMGLTGYQRVFDSVLTPLRGCKALERVFSTSPGEEK